MQIGRPDWWDDATAHLSRDPLIGGIVKKYEGESLSGRGELFQTLVRSIVGQQISVKAADAVHGRLEEMSGGKVTREALGALPLDALLSCGLSRQKSQYILGIANDETPLLPDLSLIHI